MWEFVVDFFLVVIVLIFFTVQIIWNDKKFKDIKRKMNYSANIMQAQRGDM